MLAIGIIHSDDGLAISQDVSTKDRREIEKQLKEQGQMEMDSILLVEGDAIIDSWENGD